MPAQVGGGGQGGSAGAASCGDGFVNGNEECDPGAALPPCAEGVALCTADCKLDRSGCKPWSWGKRLGSPGDDIFSGGVALDDGFVVAGFTRAAEGKPFDWVASRIRLDGSIVWSRAYGSEADDVLITQGGIVLDAGKVVLGGWSESVGGGAHRRMWALALDPLDGSVAWSTTVGASADYPMAVTSLAARLGGGLLLTGSSQGGPVQTALAFLDSAGVVPSIAYVKSTGTNGDLFSGTRTLPHGTGYLASGSYGGQGYKIGVALLDSTGAYPGGALAYGSPGTNQRGWLKPRGGAKGGWIGFGYTYPDSGPWRPLLALFDGAQKIVWQFTLGLDYFQLTDVVETDDGIVAVGDHSLDATASKNNVTLLKVDKASGQILWARRYKSAQNQAARQLLTAPGGGFLVVGDHCEPVCADKRDGLLLRVDDQGLGVPDTLDLPLVAEPVGYTLQSVTSQGLDFTAGALPLQATSALPDVRDVALSVSDLP